MVQAVGVRCIEVRLIYFNTLVLNGDAHGKVSVQVLNMVGQEVYNRSINANGRLREVIDLDSKLTNGIYILRIAKGADACIIRFSLKC